MNKKLVAGVIAGVGALSAVILGKRLKNNIPEEDVILEEEERKLARIQARVDAGGDTKPGMERQLYRDLYRLLKSYGVEEMEEFFGDDQYPDEDLEIYSAEFARLAAHYVTNHMVDVRDVSGKLNDGTEIGRSHSKALFHNKACRIINIPEEQTFPVGIDNYTELWYTEVGEWFIVHRIDFKDNNKLTYRFISSCSAFNKEIDIPGEILRREFDDFAERCLMDAALGAL